MIVRSTNTNNKQTTNTNNKQQTILTVRSTNTNNKQPTIKRQTQIINNKQS